MSREKLKEFELLARPLIKYLNDKHDPHTTIIITSKDAEVMQGGMAFQTNDYIKG